MQGGFGWWQELLGFVQVLPRKLRQAFFRAPLAENVHRPLEVHGPSRMEALRAGAASMRAVSLSSRSIPQAELRASCPRRSARRGGFQTVCSAQKQDAVVFKMTEGGLKRVQSPEELEAERQRLESVDAFAELVKMSSKAPPGVKKEKPKPIGLPEGLSKPPWLRQRAPQGNRRVHSSVVRQMDSSTLGNPPRGRIC